MRGLPTGLARSIPYHNNPGANKKTIVPASVDNLLDDGDFAKMGGGASIQGPWVLGNNWEIILSPLAVDPPIYVLQHTPGGTAIVVQSGFGVLAGVFYKITFTIGGSTTGTVRPSIGAAVGSAFSGNGTFTEIQKAVDSAYGFLSFTPSSAFDGYISAVTVTIMQPGGTGLMTDTDFTGDGSAWVITDGGTPSWAYDTVNDYIDMADAAASDTAITQAITTVEGELYIVQITIANNGPTEVVFVSIDDTAPKSLVYAQGNGTFTIPISRATALPG